jgi:hypothetical protein
MIEGRCKPNCLALHADYDRYEHKCITCLFNGPRFGSLEADIRANKSIGFTTGFASLYPSGGHGFVVTAVVVEFVDNNALLKVYRSVSKMICSVYHGTADECAKHVLTHENLLTTRHKFALGALQWIALTSTYRDRAGTEEFDLTAYTVALSRKGPIAVP